ncbi:GNAT family N-acetyltransferase [Myxosarcina sp. GI1(2024)]
MCVQFKADSLICSFGSAALLYQKDGSRVEEYFQWLRQRMTEIPNSCVHVWQEEQIIGQIEISRWKHDSSVGYVNLFYLIPEFRGRGFGRQLERYAANFLKQLGCKLARLSVSSTNIAAMKFYLKHGWIDLGQREDLPEVHYFTKSL